MAITLNSTSHSNAEDGPLTFAHEVVAGSNRILVVGVGLENSLATVTTVSGITWDGKALVQIDTQPFDDGGSGDRDRVDLWYLLETNISTKSANVVVTLAGSVDRGVNAGVICINDAKQQAPEASGKADGTGTTASATITPLTDDAWIIDVAANSSSSNDMTAGGDQTERYEEANDVRTNGSTKTLATAAETTMSWTFGVSKPWGVVAASFEEVAAGESVTVEPSAIALTSSVKAPTLNYDYVIAIGSALALTGTLKAPTIVTRIDITVSPGAISISATLKAPTICYDTVISVLAQALAIALQDVTIDTEDPRGYTELGKKHTEHTEVSKTPTSYSELSKTTTDYTELTKLPTSYTELTKNTTDYTEV